MKIIELGYKVPTYSLTMERFLSFLTCETEFIGSPWYHQYKVIGHTAEVLDIELNDLNFKVDPKKKNDFELEIDCQYDEWGTKKWCFQQLNIYRQCVGWGGKIARFVNPLEIKTILTDEGYNYFLELYKPDIFNKINNRKSDIDSYKKAIIRSNNDISEWNKLISS